MHLWLPFKWTLRFTFLTYRQRIPNKPTLYYPDQQIHNIYIHIHIHVYIYIHINNTLYKVKYSYVFRYICFIYRESYPSTLLKLQKSLRFFVTLAKQKGKTHTNTYFFIYIYIYIYKEVCVCVCVFLTLLFC